jgi:hypothetical protein
MEGCCCGVKDVLSRKLSGVTEENRDPDLYRCDNPLALRAFISLSHYLKLSHEPDLRNPNSYGGVRLNMSLLVSLRLATATSGVRTHIT